MIGGVGSESAPSPVLTDKEELVTCGIEPIKSVKDNKNVEVNRLSISES